MSFKNWSMIWKIVSMLLLIGGAGLAGAYYSTSKLMEIDGRYSELLNRDAKASARLARSGRFIVAYQSALFQNIVATTPEGNRAAVAAQNEALRGTEEQFAWVREHFPSAASMIDGFDRRLRGLAGASCGEVVRLANSSTTAEGNAEVSAIMDRDCLPQLAAVIKEITAFNISITDQVDKASDAATDVSIWSSRTTLAGISFAIIAVVGLAVFIVRNALVAPIRASMEVMAALGKGELETTIAGTERGDEIGDIAKSLEVLRGQLRAAEVARRAQAAREEAERRALARREKLAGDFVGRMQGLAASFTQSSGEVADAAKNLSATAEETSRQAQSVAAAAEEAATNVQTVSAASEEMAASVRRDRVAGRPLGPGRRHRLFGSGALERPHRHPRHGGVGDR